MPKSAQARKTKPIKKQTIETNVVHDIINKVKDNQKKMDKKLEELSLMCSGDRCRIK